MKCEARGEKFNEPCICCWIHYNEWNEWEQALSFKISAFPPLGSRQGTHRLLQIEDVVYNKDKSGDILKDGTCSLCDLQASSYIPLCNRPWNGGKKSISTLRAVIKDMLLGIYFFCLKHIFELGIIVYFFSQQIAPKDPVNKQTWRFNLWQCLSRVITVSSKSIASLPGL